MKNIYSIVILILCVIFCAGFSSVPAGGISLSYQPNVDKLEKVFKDSLPLDGVIYTKVPRGLIISINERFFFNTGDTRIKESSLYILNTIAELVYKLSNYCVIENHTEEYFNDSRNLELSLVRSANIAQYMINTRKISADRLFALGYGQYMPFKDNVSPKKGFNNRIDFVILEYEAKR